MYQFPQRRQPLPQLPQLPQLLQLLQFWLLLKASSSHSVAGGNSGREKNSSHTLSENSSQGGMGQPRGFGAKAEGRPAAPFGEGGREKGGKVCACQRILETAELLIFCKLMPESLALGRFAG